MDNKTVFIRTTKGESDISSLFGDLKRTLSLIDGKSTLDDISKKAPPSLRSTLTEVLKELVAGGFIRDKSKPEVQIATPKAPPSIPGPASSQSQNAGEELDFTSMVKAPSPSDLASEAARQKAKKDAEAVKARAEMEAAMEAAKIRANAEASAKAEAKAKLEAEQAARARAEAELKTKQETAARKQAEEKARLEAEARLRAEQEAAKAKAAFEVAARAKIEAEARVKQEAEAAARAKVEAEAKAKAAFEAAARAKIEAEARAKQEAEAVARAKAEAEARIKAELEAAAKAKAEADAKARAEAEARAKAEAESARLKAESEAAAKAKAKAEAEARAKAEEEARRKAEIEAAEKAKAEAEARARSEREASAQAEMEARIKAEQDVVERAEALAREEAEQQRIIAEATANQSSQSAAPEEFKIKLDAFVLGSDAGNIIEASNAKAQLNDGEIDLSNFKAPLTHEEIAATKNAANAASEKRAIEAQKSKKVAEEKEEEFKKSKEAAEQKRRKAEEEEARLLAEQEAKKLGDEQARAWAEAEKRSKEQAKLETERQFQQPALGKAASKVPRARRKPIAWGKISFGLVVLALIAIAALPYVYPLQDYIAPIEQQLSAQFKQPVHFSGLKAALLPMPKLELQKVEIGNKQEVKISNVVLNFDVLTMFSPVTVIRDAELQDISVNGDLLEQEVVWSQAIGGNKSFPVRHLGISNLKVMSDQVSLPVLSGESQIDAQGMFIGVSLKSDNGKFAIDLQPVKTGHWNVNLNVRENSLPALPDIVFNDFTAKGDLSESGLTISDFDARLYTGILQGTAQLTWNKGWQLQGHAEAKTMELNLMFVSSKSVISGEMYGQGNFSFSGAKLTQLGESPRLEGSFIAKKGIITGMDMVETARLMSRQHMVGGRTHFDEVNGSFLLENHNQRLSQLNISSGILSASGTVDIAKGKQLSGNFSADLKMHAGSVPLVLSGTVTEMNLRVK